MHGKTVNKDGCPVCDCSPAPNVCDNHHCPAGQKCKPEQVQCVTTPCYPQPKCVPDTVDRCSLPMEPGMCEAYMPSWGYNPDSRSCEQFIYGGCGGNDNRFVTREECEATCATNVCGPVCAIYCSYGMKSGDDGCPTCECNPAPAACQGLECHGDSEICKIVEATICPSCLAGTPPELCRCTTTYQAGCVNEFPKNCQTLECSLNCKNGRVVDTAGCPVCRCVDPEPHYCKGVSCNNGEVCKWADTGLRCSACAPGFDCPPCPTFGATCVPENPVGCAIPMCTKHCPHGYAVDRDGCMDCNECIPPPVCPQCHLGCERSTSVGLDGCQLCKCVDPPNPCNTVDCVPGMICKMQYNGPGCSHCPPGVPCDADPICSQPPHPVCVPIQGCPPICLMVCDYGHKIGPDGCPLCECNPPPMDCSVMTCAHDHICKMMTITMCPGCTSGPCYCTTELQAGCVPRHSEFCQDRHCVVSCEFGTAVDTFGCETCQCLPPPRPRCPPRHCDTALDCPYGFAQTADGCDLCVCKHPCQDFYCGGNQECKLVSLNGECEVDDRECHLEIMPMCVNKNAGCPRKRCSGYCPHGRISDPDGCGLCTCSPYPKDYTINCPAIRCGNPCKFGRKVTSDGCPTCECNPNNFQIDVCGSRAGPLRGKHNNVLTCDECHTGSECIKYSNRFTGFEVCCSTSSSPPEENGLKLDVIRLVLTFPVDFDYIRYTMDSFKSAVIAKVVLFGIRRNQIEAIHLREGSIVVDMEIDVDDENDKEAVLNVQNKVEMGQLTIRHNNRDFTASRAQVQFSYTADDDGNDGKKNKHRLIIALCTIFGVVIIVVVLAVVVYSLKKNARVHEADRGRSYERHEGNLYDNSRMTPPPIYAVAAYPEKSEHIVIS